MSKPDSKTGGGEKSPPRPQEVPVRKSDIDINANTPRGPVTEAINVPKPPVPKGDGNKK